MSDPREPFVVIPRPRGRPPAKTAAVSTRLPEPYVDKLIQAAEARNLTVAGLMRQIVILQLKKL